MPSGETVVISLAIGNDYTFEQQGIQHLKAGESKTLFDGKVSITGFEVQHAVAERSFFSASDTSEARLGLANKVAVTVGVLSTQQADESITILRELDLAGLEIFAKTHL